MKRGLFYPIRIIFHSFNSKTLCFSAQETTQKCGGRTCSRKQCRSPHPLPMLFLSSLHIKLRWKMMKLNIKIEIVSLLLARIHRKMENYLCISAEIWLLPDDLRHLSVYSPNHHTQASNSIISVFLTNCSVSMVRVLALQSNSIKRQNVSDRVSEYTWNNKQKQNRMTPQNVYL